jgi:hypothetical protein
MFWDSNVLKEELVADIENVDERLAEASEDEMEAALIAVEQFAFWAAFAICKLADSYKLSDEFEATTWPVTSYPKRPSTPTVDLLNWHRLDRHYDFAAGNQERLGLRRLCGMLVHSFVFIPEMGENGRALAAFLFNSDRTKDQAVYRLAWEDFCELIRRLYDDDVIEMSVNRRTGRNRQAWTRCRSHARRP